MTSLCNRLRTMLLTAVLSVAGTIGNAYASGKEFVPPRPPVEDATCAGVRGNGANLFAHYGVIARHIEEYGNLTCASGGSSGAITVFLLESMWRNPIVHQCRDGKTCGRAVRDRRFAFLVKSFVGLSEAGLFQDVATITELLNRVSDEQVMEMMHGEMPGVTPEEGVAALVRILRDLGPLINRDLIELLVTSENRVFLATDIIEGLQMGAQFMVNSSRVYLRTSVLDFNEVASLFGTYGSFYAGYEPVRTNRFNRWVRQCSRQSVGLTWQEIAVLPGPNGRTCGQMLVELFNEFREKEAKFGGKNRADEKVGKFLPVFGVTGVVTGDSVETWRIARDAWLAGNPVEFEPDFSDVGVGYWGKPRELSKMDRRLDRRYNDLNSMQFVPLGQPKWREVLKSSPAEPGFSPAVELENGSLSVGGWADPLRVIPLDALKPHATIAVNRQDGVGSFTIDATRLLNATEADIDALYSTSNPASSFYIGLETASGVWCTNWDGQMSIPNMLFDNAYTSPLITTFRKFLRPRFDYENVGAGTGFLIDGCVPMPGAG
ncbi:MAG: hypothetical protein AAFR21_19010 [Pseudomonadota bacterium]